MDRAVVSHLPSIFQYGLMSALKVHIEWMTKCEEKILVTFKNQHGCSRKELIGSSTSMEVSHSFFQCDFVFNQFSKYQLILKIVQAVTKLHIEFPLKKMQDGIV